MVDSNKVVELKKKKKRSTWGNAESDLVVTLEELLHNPLPENNGPYKEVRKQRLGRV